MAEIFPVTLRIHSYLLEAAAIVSIYVLYSEKWVTNFLQCVHCLSVHHTVHLFVLCHHIHCCLLQCVHCQSVHHTVPSVGSVSLCPLLSSTVCPVSISTSHCTVCLFCVTMSTAVSYSLSAVSQYLTLHMLSAARLPVHPLLLRVTAVTNVTLSSPIVWAKKMGLLMLAVKFVVSIIKI
jgi:hypothetical protein